MCQLYLVGTVSEVCNVYFSLLTLFDRSSHLLQFTGILTLGVGDAIVITLFGSHIFIFEPLLLGIHYRQANRKIQVVPYYI
jgi:hypothetical protein